MLLTEFDEKKYKRTIYSEGYEDGEQAGYSRGEQAGAEKVLKPFVYKELQKGKGAEEIAKELEQDIALIREIIEKME